MSSVRVLYQNLITSGSQLTVSNTTPGGTGLATTVLSGVQALKAEDANGKTGSAMFERRGTYTGTIERTYVVQAYSVQAPGGFLNTLIRWSDTGGDSWSASEFAPIPGIWVLLSHGVEVRWTLGTAQPYFVQGDTWLFKAIQEFGPQRALDLSRDTEYQSDGVTATNSLDVVIDFGTAQQPTALIVDDHNIGSGATITLAANSSSSWGSPPFSQSVTWRTKKLVHFFSHAGFRYHRLRITPNANHEYIRMSELYLGLSYTLNKAFSIGFRRERRPLGGAIEPSILAHGMVAATPIQQVWAITFPRIKAGVTEDLTRWQTVWDTINDVVNGNRKPLYFVADDTNLADVSLYHWENAFEWEHRFLDRYGVPISLAEVVRTKV